jgi:hypothetical protein
MVLAAAVHTTAAAAKLAPSAECEAVLPVLDKVGTHADGSRPRFNPADAQIGSVGGRAPETSGIAGIWIGQAPSLDLYRLWATARQANAVTCSQVSTVMRRRGVVLQPAEAIALVRTPRRPPAPVTFVYTVSRAVLASDRREALVAVRSGANDLGAHEDLYLVRRQGSAWVVVGQGQLSTS